MSDQPATTAVFCDDVRQEIGNKISLIGCYTDELIVDRLPASLPKLAVHVRVTAPVGAPFRKLRFVARFGEHVLGELAAPEQELRGMASGSGPSINANAILILTPFQVATPGRLCVEVETEYGT